MVWRGRLWFAGVLLAACASPGEEHPMNGAVVDGGGPRVVTPTAPPDASAAPATEARTEVDIDAAIAAAADASSQSSGPPRGPGGTVTASAPGGSTARPDAAVAPRDAGAARDAASEAGGASGAGGRAGAAGRGGGFMTVSGIGGAGGQGGSTGAAGAGGRGAESCESLEARYRAALGRAVVCDFFALGPTCQQLADSSLACPGCKIAVDDTSVLDDSIARWEGSGCGNLRRDCPAVVCANLHSGLCIPRGDGAVCDGTTAVAPAP